MKKKKRISVVLAAVLMFPLLSNASINDTYSLGGNPPRLKEGQVKSVVSFSA